MSKRRATLLHQAEIISCIPGPHRRADNAAVFRADSIAAYLTRSVAQRFTAIIKTEGRKSIETESKQSTGADASAMPWLDDLKS